MFVSREPCSARVRKTSSTSRYESSNADGIAKIMDSDLEASVMSFSGRP